MYNLILLPSVTHCLGLDSPGNRLWVGDLFAESLRASLGTSTCHGWRKQDRAEGGVKLRYIHSKDLKWSHWELWSWAKGPGLWTSALLTLGRKLPSWRRHDLGKGSSLLEGGFQRVIWLRAVSHQHSQQLGNECLCPKGGVFVTRRSICYIPLIVLIRSASFICSVLWTASLGFWLVSFGAKLPREDSWDHLSPHRHS